MRLLKYLFYFLFLIILFGINIQCKNESKKTTIQNNEISNQENFAISKSQFDHLPDGTVVDQYHLTNANDVTLSVITYGGRITSLKVPNRNGDLENVVLNFDNLQDYLDDNPFFGALIGRYGNRIAKGKFSLNNQEYTLDTNDGENHLHGGNNGFDRRVWMAEPIENEGELQLKLTYLSKDGEEGYPGNLNVTVVYALTKDNTLEVSYEAITDKTTVINLTQHSYFNLTGNFSKSILEHEVAINADSFLPIDATLIPTGEIRNVVGTPFDFRVAKSIGQNIDANNKQLILGKGYDHCWLLNGELNEMRLAATAYDRKSGRFLEIYTDQPGIQFYTGNFLDGTLNMPTNGRYEYRTGFCLETQHYPNSPNQKEFPSVVLRPGEKYQTKTKFKFSAK